MAKTGKRPRPLLPWHTPVVEHIPMAHVIGPGEAIHLVPAPFVTQLFDAMRFGASLVRVGRPSVDPALCAELRAELGTYVQGGGKKPLAFVQGRLKARGLSMSPNTIQRKIIWKTTT
jgi:hypothetical protein